MKPKNIIGNLKEVKIEIVGIVPQYDIKNNLIGIDICILKKISAENDEDFADQSIEYHEKNGIGFYKAGKYLYSQLSVLHGTLEIFIILLLYSIWVTGCIPNNPDILNASEQFHETVQEIYWVALFL